MWCLPEPRACGQCCGPAAHGPGPGEGGAGSHLSCPERRTERVLEECLRGWVSALHPCSFFPRPAQGFSQRPCPRVQPGRGLCGGCRGGACAPHRRCRLSGRDPARVSALPWSLEIRGLPDVVFLCLGFLICEMGLRLVLASRRVRCCVNVGAARRVPGRGSWWVLSRMAIVAVRCPRFSGPSPTLSLLVSGCRLCTQGAKSMALLLGGLGPGL